MRDPRYDILFEPVRIGPVVARNRFYQVPHCNGMGHRHPSAVAAMRGIKAEGGWAVVCTEETEIHPSSDLSPYIELRNWDDRDIATLALIPDKIHEHGSLAGIELVHNGLHISNRYSREVPPPPPPTSGGLDRSGAGSPDGQVRHRRHASMAPRRNRTLDPGWVRHRVRLCGAHDDGHPAIPHQAVQRSNR